MHVIFSKHLQGNVDSINVFKYNNNSSKKNFFQLVL